MVAALLCGTQGRLEDLYTCVGTLLFSIMNIFVHLGQNPCQPLTSGELYHGVSGHTLQTLARLYPYTQGRIQDLWNGGRSGYRECRRREGFWRVPFEDPLWNFKKGGRRAPPPPPPPLESASDTCMLWTTHIYPDQIRLIMQILP